ncbi:MAG: LytR C-terminal domain-containing protein [Candidatus Eisenbacteria bacterium]|nr:LytR C-terminal domain-containing protein [Candidatus Eisenbacteria bacterium]
MATRKRKTTTKPSARGKRKRRATPASALYTVGIVVLLGAIVYLVLSLYGLFAPQASRDVEAAVRVLNGCGVEGLGLRTTRFLRDKGIDVVDFENADSFDYEESIVVDRSGDMGAALEIARLLRIPNVIQQIPDNPLVDVVIIVGADYEEFFGPEQDGPGESRAQN